MQWPGTELQRSEWFADVRQFAIERRLAMSASDYVGYLSTISAYLELPTSKQVQVYGQIMRVLPETVEVAADITVHLACRHCERYPSIQTCRRSVCERAHRSLPRGHRRDGRPMGRGSGQAWPRVTDPAAASEYLSLEDLLDLVSAPGRGVGIPACSIQPVTACGPAPSAGRSYPTLAGKAAALMPGQASAIRRADPDDSTVVASTPVAGPASRREGR
jgi:hypothetical protein